MDKMTAKRKIFTISLLMISIFSLVSLTAYQNLIGNQSSTIQFQADDNLPSINVPDSSYESINKNGVPPVGNITVLDITEMDKGEIITAPPYAMEYPSNIGYKYVGYDFIGVDEIADNDDEDFQGFVSILVNDSIKVNYTIENTNKLVCYKSELSQGILEEVYVNDTLIDLDDIIYYDGGYIYNYSKFTNYNAEENQTIQMSYFIAYNISIGNWITTQDSTLDAPYLTENINEITGYYNYTFTPGVIGLNLTAVFMINPPDAEYLNDINLRTYGSYHPEGGTAVNTNDYTIESNNSVRFEVSANGSQYSLNFNANFTLEFKNIHAGLWSRDYLLSGRDIRKRDYELSVVDGPNSLLISNFRINESGLPFKDLQYVQSLFNRPIQDVLDMNYTTEVGGSIGTTLYFREDTFLDHYYLVKGETDILSLVYKSHRFLNILIVDHINVPKKGVLVKLYYDNVSFGTLMSNNLEYSVPTKETDNQGQVQFSEVPYGDFVIEIIYRGVSVQNSTVNPSNVLNIVRTSIIHFPSWIITFSLISIGMIVIGLYIYRKEQ